MSNRNEILEPRFGLQLSKMFGMQDRNPSGDVATEVFPNVTLENDRPEWKYLGGEKMCSVAFTVAAGGAGNKGALKITNLASSGTLIIVEQISVGCFTAGTQFTIGRSNSGTVLANSITGGPRDSRWPEWLANPTFQHSAKITWNYTVGSFLSRAMDLIFSSGSAWHQWKVPVVLAPDSGLVLENNFANVEFSGAIHWRERAILSTEGEK